MIRGLRHSLRANVVINRESEQSTRGIMWTTPREIYMEFVVSRKKKKDVSLGCVSAQDGSKPRNRETRGISEYAVHFRIQTTRS